MKKLLLVLPMTLMFVGCNTQEIVHEEIPQKQEVTDFEKGAFVYSLSDLGYITKMNTKTNEVTPINQVGFTSVYNDNWSSIQFVSETKAYTIGERSGVVIEFNPSTGEHKEVAKPNWSTQTNSVDAFYKTLEIVNEDKAYTILKEKDGLDIFGVLVEVDLKNKEFKKVNETLKMPNVGGNLKVIDEKTAYTIDLTGTLFKIDLSTGQFQAKGVPLVWAGIPVSKDEQWMGIGYVSESKIYTISQDTGTIVVIDATMKVPARVISNKTAESVHRNQWMSLSAFSETLAYIISHDGTLVKVNPTTGEFKKVLSIKEENVAGHLIEDSWCSVSFSGFVQ